MNNSVHEFAKLVVVLVPVILMTITTTTDGGAVGVVVSSSLVPYCNIEGASADYEAHKAYVLDELAIVTPTIQGYNYSTAFPPIGYTAAHDFVQGSADCAQEVKAWECVSCLIGAKLSLAQICASHLYGSVNLPLCRMSFAPVEIS